MLNIITIKVSKMTSHRCAGTVLRSTNDRRVRKHYKKVRRYMI